METINTILVPVDLDAPSHAALDAALPLAKTLNSRIVLLHVVPFDLSNVPDDLFYSSPNVAVRTRTRWMEALAELAESRKSFGVPIHNELRQGIVWDEIVGLARHLPAQLIVIGTHGRRGLPRGLMGSVAERVVRVSPVPVMSVRAKHPDDEPSQPATGQ